MDEENASWFDRLTMTKLRGDANAANLVTLSAANAVSAVEGRRRSDEARHGSTDSP
jgi:hypothetical protein